MKNGSLVRNAEKDRSTNMKNKNEGYLIDTGPSRTVGNCDGDPASVLISQRFVTYFLQTNH
jgi:hypothetical protein